MARREEAAEKRRAYAREWRRKNPEKTRLYRKGYRERHPEKVAQSERAWREANREHLRKSKAKRDAVRVDPRYWLCEAEGLAASACALRWSGLHWEQVQARQVEASHDAREAELSLFAEVWFGDL